MYDVAIIGLGPAGATAALHLPSHLRVLAIDQKREQSHAKPCGGLLAPDAQKSLSRFHLTMPKEILVDPQIFSVRTIDLGTGLVRYYQRHYINLNRHAFDLWLMQKIPERVERVTGTCVSLERTQEGFSLLVDEGGTLHPFAAKYVIGGDGANSIVRRTLFPHARISSYLSIQQWFEDEHETPFYSCVFDSSITDSYAWGLSKDQHFLFGGAFFKKTAKQDFERLKEKLTGYGFHLSHPVRTQACSVLRPRRPGDFCCAGRRALLVGEAAGFISPSSLEGISYAIDSGFLCAQSFQKSMDPAAYYARHTSGLRRSLLVKTLKRPFLYHPLLRSLVMRSGITAIRPFDAQ